jgi:hypothetical protein
MNKKERHPVPTGNPWKPSEQDPATVPVPLPVIIVKVEGPYMERDRKLWTFLLHAVWDEIPDDLQEEKLVIHELTVTKINQVFRECGGAHHSKWIWESAKRLAKTTVEWEDEEYEGIENLLNARITKQAQASGVLYFHFPTMLTPRIKKAKRFARLRTHFMLGLCGKYAVTLYELLESVANKINPVLDVPVVTLRQWLKVADGKLITWDNFNRRALLPAVEQINANPLGSGFTVAMQPIKKGRAVDRVRFQVHKVDERRSIEEAMQGGKQLTDVGNKAKTSNHLSVPLFGSIHLKTSDFERAKAAAPGWDIYCLEQEWRSWIAKKEQPENPGKAFVAFCRKKYQREGKPERNSSKRVQKP